MRTLPDSVQGERILSQPRLGNQTLSEMQGYEEMGMHREALQVVRRILRRRTVTAEEFERAIWALLTMGNRLKQSVGMVERAYQRLRKADRKKVRRVMLSFYSSVGDHAKAMAHATCRPKDAQEFMFSLDAFGGGEKKAAIRRLVRFGLKVLGCSENSLEQNCVRSALASHFVSEGRWDIGLALWSEAPTDLVFCCQKFSDRVRIHAAQGLQIIRQGPRELAELEKQNDPDLDVSQPGLNRELLQEAREELLRFQKALERILPKKEWKHFGLATGD